MANTENSNETIKVNTDVNSSEDINSKELEQKKIEESKLDIFLNMMADKLNSFQTNFDEKFNIIDNHISCITNEINILKYKNENETAVDSECIIPIETKKKITEIKDIPFEPYKRVALQHMKPGSAVYQSADRSHILNFKSLFDIERKSWLAVRALIDNNRDEFYNSNIAILDEDIRQAEGIETFIDKNKFEEILKTKNVDDMIRQIDAIKDNLVKYAFLLYYGTEYNANNLATRDQKRFDAVNKYFTKYDSMPPIYSIFAKMAEYTVTGSDISFM